MSLKHSKEFTAKVPPQLLQSLRSANVADSDSKTIETKLQERTSSQIVSYLQLALIKLRQTSVAASEFSTQMQAQRERVSFGQFLEEQVADMRNNS
jgi:hypothetical protein